MNQESLKEFTEIYKKEFGVELSDREALEKALSLASLFRAIYRPIPIHKQVVYKTIKGCYKTSSGPYKP